MKLPAILAFLALSALPALADVGSGSVQTSASGTPYVALASSGQAKVVHVLNNTGTALQVQLGGTGAAVPIADGTGFSFRGVGALSQLAVRRTDVSATQVTVTYVYEN